jgi:putative endonuclease
VARAAVPAAFPITSLRLSACDGSRGLLASLPCREDGGAFDKMSQRDLIARASAWIAELRAQLPLGRRGERAAEKHLRRSGYRIVARNFRAAGAEIDIVAMDGDVLVFVEVKTRRSREAGAPEEAVDERKQKRMRRAAEIFAIRYRADDITMRFDVVAIDASGERLEIELLRNAF